MITQEDIVALKIIKTKCFDNTNCDDCLLFKSTVCRGGSPDQWSFPAALDKPEQRSLLQEHEESIARQAQKIGEIGSLVKQIAESLVETNRNLAKTDGIVEVLFKAAIKTLENTNEEFLQKIMTESTVNDIIKLNRGIPATPESIHEIFKRSDNKP